MIRYILNDLNPVELTCCPFMISVDKRSESCETLLMTYLQKYVLSKMKDVNVRNETKIMIKHISCD